MTTIPFSPSLAQELAEREAFLQRTSAERRRKAQALIQSCFPPTELRLVSVLVPYQTLEGHTRYRKVPEWRTLPV